MTYESMAVVSSKVEPSVRFTVVKMSYGRRMELMQRVRDLACRLEFLRAGSSPEEKMDAALLEGQINRVCLSWGLRAVSGLMLDGVEATPETLVDSGPEELFREAVAAVRAQSGLSETERKN
jgi:hypothetical protein